MKKALKLFVVFIVLLGVLLPVHPQRVKLNASVDIQAAADNNPQVGEVGSFRPTLEDFTPNFIVFPTLSADLKGPSYAGQFYYSLGVSRFPQENELNYESHHFGGQLEAQLSSKLRLSFHERFIKSPDFNQSVVLEGIRVTPEGLFFDFENVLLRDKSYANTAVVDFGYQTSPTSELVVGVSNRLRRFSAEPTNSSLTDQDSYNGYVEFRKEIEARTSWDVRYDLNLYEFKDYEDVQGHNVSLGLSHDLTPNVSVRLGGGPTLSTERTSNVRVGGYNADVRIGYTRDEDLVSLVYYRRSGATTGLGSLSDTQRISFNFHKGLWGDLLLSGLVGAYETKPLFDNPVETRGLMANLVLTLPLKGGWSFRAGGSINEQDGTSEYQLDRTRVFVGLRYTLPGFLTF